MAARRVYVAGNMTTRSFTVQTTNIPIGVFVVPATQDTSGLTVQLAAANASNVLGIAYAADYKGKYTSGSDGSGVGTALNQNSVTTGNKVTVIMRGCGAVVEAFCGTTNLSAGIAVKTAAGGSVVPITGNEAPNQHVGTTLTAAANASDKVFVLLNY